MEKAEEAEEVEAPLLERCFLERVLESVLESAAFASAVGWVLVSDVAESVD